MKLFGFIVTATLLSCFCGQTELSDIDKRWIANYKYGEEIIFKSNLNNFDTFTVIEKRDFHTDCNPLETSSTKYHVLSVDMNEQRCHDSNYCNVTISLTKHKQRETADLFIRVLGLEYSSKIQNNQLELTQLTLSTSNKTYDSCYIFQSGSLANSYGNNYLSVFFWNQKYGLIKYISSNNESFELYKMSK